jgi:nitric oxide synthase-interacting protein
MCRHAQAYLDILETSQVINSSANKFLQECILEHILGQKKDLKRQRALLERMSLEEEAERKATLAAARERVLHDFERAQAGISTQTKISSNTPNTTKSSVSVSTRTSAAGPRLEELTTAAERAALETLEREALASRRAKLPNFWLPSLTPSAPPTRVSALPSSQLRPLCHVSNRKGENRAHPIKLSDLVAVYFEAELTSSDSSSKKNSLKCCAGCRKALNKNTKLAGI